MTIPTMQAYKWRAAPLSMAFPNSGPAWNPITQKDVEQGIASHTYENALYGFFFKKCYLKKEDADDCLQETYLRTWKYFSYYEPNTNFRAWLFQIAKNVVINSKRRKSNLPMESLDDIVEPHAIIQEQEAHAIQPYSPRIRAAIMRLPYKYREVLLLADEEDLSYEQIGEIIGSPAGTAMSRLFRARVRVAEALAEQELALDPTRDEAATYKDLLRAHHVRQKDAGSVHERVGAAVRQAHRRTAKNRSTLMRVDERTA
jgi:RNA polymerase sigma-70 factor (ECF subfamily)